MNILIIGPSWVGDMVMAQTLFICLKQRHPECQIDVLAPAWSKPILERMPEVREALALPFAHGEFDFSARKALGRALKGKYQQAILLPNSLKSAFVPFFADTPLRTGWRGEMRYGLLNDIRKLNKADYPLMIERFMALAYAPNQILSKPYPQPRLQIDAEKRTQVMENFALKSDKPILALCPGAEFGEAKRWPASHYAEVAEHYIKQGMQVWIFGSQKDQPVGEEICQALSENAQKSAVNLAGRTDLAEAVDLLSLSEAVISNDSGLMHVAAALNRPIVAIYGSTSPDFTPPLADQVAIVRTGIACSPCFDRTCRYGHYHCLRLLYADKVIDALDNLLGKAVHIIGA